MNSLWIILVQPVNVDMENKDSFLILTRSHSTYAHLYTENQDSFGWFQDVCIISA